VSAVDYGPGNAQYKELLSNQRWQDTSVYIFAPSIKGISLNLVRSFLAGIDQYAKKVLNSTRLLQRVKKRWRAHVTPNVVAQS